MASAHIRSSKTVCSSLLNQTDSFFNRSQQCWTSHHIRRWWRRGGLHRRERQQRRRPDPVATSDGISRQSWGRRRTRIRFYVVVCSIVVADVAFYMVSKPGSLFHQHFAHSFLWENFASSFLYLHFIFVLFWRKNICAKAVQKMSEKLTPVVSFTNLLAQGANGLAFRVCC